ncbi:MAG: histidine triad nucleotide-binding protein [Smithellaceae bacterium]|nr:histidine triad nucleotide-binding protein [Smithellaceae bacterium]
MDECVFCKIVAGSIPCSKVYEDDTVLAFDDIQPMAPIHVIVVPKQHVATLMDLTPADGEIMKGMILAAQEVAKKKGVAQRGFRTVVNCGSEGGQIVMHLHMHVLGGEKLKDDLA